MSMNVQNAIKSLTNVADLPEVADETTEVPMRVRELEQSLEQLHSVIGALEGRLAPVLGYAEEGKCMASNVDGSSPLGETIMKLNCSTLSATARVRDLLHRLEV